jgi:anhydro-N-acetylmuramic acid kinase
MEPGAFEKDSNRMENLPNGAFTFFTGRNRTIGYLLEHFEVITAFLTLVFVCRHNCNTPEILTCAARKAAKVYYTSDMTESSTTRALTVVGLMSGTSVDGIDAAVVQITGSGREMRVDVLSTAAYDYPEQVRDDIFRLFRPETSTVDAVSAMNFRLGELFADAAMSAIESAGLKTDQIDLIASHGQTIWHDPNSQIRSTLQIGEPSIIAARTGITVVADFRPADMAHGGQGAPLVPYPDWILFSNQNSTRAVQNIGGIANVTYLPAGGGIDDIIAFNTGPGNMLIDAAVDRLFGLPFDRDGDIASQGNL